MLIPKQKKNQAVKGNRFLISISVLGSAGPLRFVTNEDDLVADVIGTALKSYAREGRLPVLGSRTDDFILYCPIAGTEALVPWSTIGSAGVRNFVLCKKPQTDGLNEESPARSRKAGGGSRILKAWFGKYRTPKIFSH